MANWRGLHSIPAGNQLRELKSLDLSGCPLVPGALQQLGRLVMLVSLDLSRCGTNISVVPISVRNIHMSRFKSSCDARLSRSLKVRIEHFSIFNSMYPPTRMESLNTCTYRALACAYVRSHIHSSEQWLTVPHTHTHTHTHTHAPIFDHSSIRDFFLTSHS